jgi:hypothetical protein
MGESPAREMGRIFDEPIFSRASQSDVDVEIKVDVALGYSGHPWKRILLGRGSLIPDGVKNEPAILRYRQPVHG